jgi:hypothetical protein
VSVVVRVVRQFHEGADAVTLEKALVLPDTPTIGTRLDLRSEGVESPLTVVGVTLLAIADGPGLRAPSVEVVLFWEPQAAAEARQGWRPARAHAPRRGREGLTHA